MATQRSTQSQLCHVYEHDDHQEGDGSYTGVSDRLLESKQPINHTWPVDRPPWRMKTSEWDWSENEGAGASEPSYVVVVKTPKVNLVRLAWSAPWNELRLAEQLVKA